jgi:predicted O-methyltransferase YrrM
VRDGWNYPMLRLQSRNRLAPAGALAVLGFDAEELVEVERDFEAVAGVLYPRLLARAQSVGDAEAERRLAAPSSSSRDAKRLLYLAVRILRPALVVETGPFNGASSTFLLRALEAAGGDGRLLSFDLPDARDALGVPIPEGREPAWLVPDELRHRFELVLGDARDTLRRRLAREEAVDLFFHDSLHTTRHMLFEFRTAWRHLRRGGVLVSDDVFWNPAFWLFTRLHRVPFRHIGTMGVTRKP